MWLTLDIPDSIASDAEAQLSNSGKTLVVRLKEEIAKWALEYRSAEAKKEIVVQDSDLKTFCGVVP